MTEDIDKCHGCPWAAGCILRETKEDPQTGHVTRCAVLRNRDHRDHPPEAAAAGTRPRRKRWSSIDLLDDIRITD